MTAILFKVIYNVQIRLFQQPLKGSQDQSYMSVTLPVPWKNSICIDNITENKKDRPLNRSLIKIGKIWVNDGA